MATFQHRLVGAIRLQPSVFEEVEHDTTATGQAVAVVAIAGISSGVAFVWYGGFVGVVSSMVWALVTWAMLAGSMWIVGTKILPGRRTEADLGQLLRTTGFAAAPGLLWFIGVIPVFGWFIWIGVMIWVLAATVVAVRQALDYEDTLRAVLSVALASVVVLLVTSAVVLAGALWSVVVS